MNYSRNDLRVRTDMAARPIRTHRGGGAAPVATPYRTLLVTGGNGAGLGAGLEGILYNPAPITLTQAYDPNVDTAYPDGLGRGVLFNDGVPSAGYVLIRHNYTGHAWPVLAGDLLRVCGTTTLTYDPGGGNPVVTMTTYIFDFA